MLVLMAHATGTVGVLKTTFFPAWLPVAELGVGVVFVISGYLLWPALMLLLGTRRAVLAALAGIVLAPLSRLAIYKLAPQHSGGVGEYFPTICDGLAIGCLLALAQPWLARRTRYLRFAAGPLFWVVPLAAVASLYASQRLFLRATITPLIVNLSIALVIDRCVRFRHLLATRVLEWRPLIRSSGYGSAGATSPRWPL